MSDDQQDQLKDIHASNATGATYTRNGNSREKRIVDALLIAAATGIMWQIFQIKDTQAIQQASIASLQSLVQMQQKQIDRGEVRQDSLEGKITRGGPDALDKQ